MKQPAIHIYTKSACPNCVSAKDLLKQFGLGYIEHDMDSAEVRQAFCIAYPDIRQMPQIFINDQRVGGLAGLKAAIATLGIS